jgi:hypothetical protein
MQQYLKPYLRKSKHTKMNNSNLIGDLPIGDLPRIHSSITINQQCPHHTKNNNIAVNFALELHDTLIRHSHSAGTLSTYITYEQTNLTKRQTTNPTTHHDITPIRQPPTSNSYNCHFLASMFGVSRNSL